MVNLSNRYLVSRFIAAVAAQGAEKSYRVRILAYADMKDICEEDFKSWYLPQPTHPSTKKSGLATAHFILITNLITSWHTRDNPPLRIKVFNFILQALIKMIEKFNYHKWSH